MRRGYFAAVVLVGILPVLGAQAGFAAATSPSVRDRDVAVQRALEAMVRRGELIGAVAAVYKDGRASYVAVGRKYVGEPAPDRNTLYPLASVTKVFTSALLADAVAAGKIKLDDPIDSYLPAYAHLRPAVKGKLTFERLATFTASLPDGTPPRYKTARQYFEGFLSRWTPRWPIGTKDKYSDMSYEILAFVVPRVAGSSYESLLGKVVTGPLEMTDTYPITQRNPDSDRAYGIAADGKKTRYSRHSWDGVGYLTSTPADMMRFLQACAGASAGNPALERALTLATKPYFPMRQGAHQGLAWVIHTVSTSHGAATLISKDGGIAGFSSLVVVDPHDHSGIVFLSSRDSRNKNSHPQARFMAIARRLLLGTSERPTADRSGKRAR